MIAFVPLNESALDKVLRWRTDPEVTRFLCTDIAPDPEAQLRWFDRIAGDPSCVHWLIRQDDQDVGLAYLTEIDRQARHCSCGFYIGEPEARRLGGVILPGIVNHVFTDLDFLKIWGEVLGGNTNIRKLHDLLGYREVGVFREHVLKAGQRHDLHLFELMRSDWEERLSFFRQFRIPVLDSGEGAP
jgi:UDP-4-amino-4,6-dideoxy-N-acetyl-beta-L-altrosamine N-acetyltransferase